MGNGMVTKEHFDIEMKDIREEMKEMKNNIKEFFDYTRKCKVHDSEIESMKLDILNINNNVIPNFREERNKMIDKVEVKIDSLTDEQKKSLKKQNKILISIIAVPTGLYIINLMLPVLKAFFTQLFF